MVDDLVAAVDAYRRAQAEVAQAQDELASKRAAVPERRADLAAAIVRAARAGMRQRDIVDVTGYARESVRRILRAAGIEADGD